VRFPFLSLLFRKLTVLLTAPQPRLELRASKPSPSRCLFPDLFRFLGSRRQLFVSPLRAFFVRLSFYSSFGAADELYTDVDGVGRIAAMPLRYLESLAAGRPSIPGLPWILSGTRDVRPFLLVLVLLLTRSFHSSSPPPLNSPSAAPTLSPAPSASPNPSPGPQAQPTSSPPSSPPPARSTSSRRSSTASSSASSSAFLRLRSSGHGGGRRGRG
jgi:hypothetical protein